MGEVYGTAAAEVGRLGSVARYKRLRAIAAKERLDLNHWRDRQRAEGMLFAEAACTVKAATTFDEAMAAALRRTKTLAFSEEDKANAARVIMSERPDLVREAYGSRIEPSDDDVTTLMLSEAVNDELKHIDVFRADRLGEATRRAVARNPKLAKRDYGTRKVK